jgi:tetratricopeptide (TPR) repeat protein
MSDTASAVTALPMRRCRPLHAMRPPGLLCILLLSLTCPALRPEALGAAPRWLKLESDHFELLTSAGEDEGRNLLLHLEQARNFFITSMGKPSNPASPVCIIGFNSETEFESFRPSEWSAGFYVGSPNRDYIVLKDTSARYYPVAIHEFVHVLMQQAGQHAPLWWQEGLAEVYSTLRILNGKAEVGAVNARRFRVLKGQPLPDLAALMGVDRSAPIHRDPNGAEIFYAESWALAHMLCFAEPYRLHLASFLNGLPSATGPEELFAKAYGKTLVQVQADFDDYLRRSEFKSLFLPVQLEHPQGDIKVTPATDLELSVAFSYLSVGVNKGKDARLRLDRLSLAYPESWEVEESLGYTCWLAENRDEARYHLGRAVERGMTNARTYMNYVGLLGETRVANSVLISLVEKALELQPENRPAHLKLASLYLRDGQYARAVEAIYGLEEVSPEEAFQASRLSAYAFWGMEDFASARQSVEEAMSLARTAAETAEVARLFQSLAARQ